MEVNEVKEITSFRFTKLSSSLFLVYDKNKNNEFNLRILDNGYWKLEKLDGSNLDNQTAIGKIMLKELHDGCDNAVLALKGGILIATRVRNILENKPQKNILDVIVDGVKIRDLIGSGAEVVDNTNNEPVNTQENLEVLAQADEELNDYYKYNVNAPSQLTPREFYELLLYELDHYKYKPDNINLNDYFTKTDYLDRWFYKSYRNNDGLHLGFTTEEEKINYLFAEFAYHRGNRQANPLVDFRKNKDLFKEVLCDFSVGRFLSTYPTFNEFTKEQFKRLAIDKYKNKVVEIEKAYKLLYNMAFYLSDKTYDEVLADLHSHENGNPANVIEYFVNEVVKPKLGVSFTLACDFIKELPGFDNIVKPDMHVKDFLRIYLASGATMSDKAALNNANRLVNEINKSYEAEINAGMERVSCYKLDRILYLLGSGYFFLDTDSRSKFKASHYKWQHIMVRINNRKDNN